MCFAIRFIVSEKGRSQPSLRKACLCNRSPFLTAAPQTEQQQEKAAQHPCVSLLNISFQSMNGNQKQRVKLSRRGFEPGTDGKKHPGQQDLTHYATVSQSDVVSQHPQCWHIFHRRQNTD